jgi:hypothetical protein
MVRLIGADCELPAQRARLRGGEPGRLPVHLHRHAGGRPPRELGMPGTRFRCMAGVLQSETFRYRREKR